MIRYDANTFPAGIQQLQDALDKPIDFVTDVPGETTLELVPE